MVTMSRRMVLAGGAVALAAPRLLTATGARAQEASASVAPLVYPRKVGELEVTAISDGYVEFPGLPFVNIDEEEVRTALTAAFLDPAAPLRLGVTAHLVRGGGRTLLIDSGAADTFGTTLGRLPAALAALGVQPADVQAVLLTHMHVDHIGGLLAGDSPAFPNATVHVDETDLEFWTDEATAAQAPKDFQPFFARARVTAAAYGDRIQPFAGETEVLPGVTSVPLPGHTVGHTGFRLASGDAEIIVFGDTAHSSAVQFTHPEASLSFDTDPAKAAESRQRFFDMVASDRTLVACTHVPFPGVGHVARASDAYAWVPEHWHYM
jgi:glyoxylase-like metal-dependent hydrolase (beta-lactamase superfamily II)